MNIFILGANSDIIGSFVKKTINQENKIYLSSRNYKNLLKQKKFYKTKYNKEIQIFEYDLSKKIIPENIKKILIKTDILIFAAGILHYDNKDRNKDLDYFFEVNFLSIVRIVEFVANIMSKKNHRTQIIALSSVAGERGRKSNYMYGSSKSALTQYFSGLRQKFSKTKLVITTIKLGFVKSKMTNGLKMLSFLSSDSNSASQLLVSAIKYRRDVMYSKNYKVLMLMIKLIPEFIFKKLNL